MIPVIAKGTARGSAAELGCVAVELAFVTVELDFVTVEPDSVAVELKAEVVGDGEEK